MSQIIWLASYPKSGNTWARVFLEHYTQGGDTDINQLSIGHAADAVLAERFGLVEQSELSREEAAALRPALYRALAAAASGPLFLKVHDAFGHTRDGSALFPPDITQAVMYLLRNPLDVAVSLSHHLAVPLDTAVNCLCDDQLFLGGETDGKFVQTIGSWSAHVRSWVDGDVAHVHVVRYEDMSADPVRTFTTMAAACGLPIDPKAVDRALAASRFDRLQTQERAEGFRERYARSTSLFFRNGRVGEGRERLGEDLVRRIVDAHGEMMRRFGYL